MCRCGRLQKVQHAIVLCVPMFYLLTCAVRTHHGLLLLVVAMEHRSLTGIGVRGALHDVGVEDGVDRRFWATGSSLSGNRSMLAPSPSYIAPSVTTTRGDPISSSAFPAFSPFGLVPLAEDPYVQFCAFHFASEFKSNTNSLKAGFAGYYPISIPNPRKISHPPTINTVAATTE
jgi:hypothetical protein